MRTPDLLVHDPLSFLRLFLAVGIGVGSVTIVLSFAVGSPALGVALGCVVMLSFVLVVVHEVKRLLDDEEPSA